ncbi:GntR family transcriptional regulator [Agromyces archimandritae]|uniref:GntR family transcriptional regulator n=1 Tax=Agromyces archimandritae TaxID=2781962 RepID=A0A975IQ44_9MICO|nr:GntR family transcriptional regulator [Agromyces archimandritae]
MSLARHSDTPVYRQIVAQLAFTIEAGRLLDGDRLPGARLLAANLGINRNTVARAYAELRDLGLVEPRGRNGMVVCGAERARAASSARERGRGILEEAVGRCRELGLGDDDIRALLGGAAGPGAGPAPEISFVECNRDRAEYFAGALAAELAVPVDPLVLGEFEAGGVSSELVLTTFFHLAEVRRRFRGTGAEVIAIVVAPHLRTLVEIAQLPKGRVVGVWWTSEDQAVSVRDSFAQAGVTDLRVLTTGDDAELEGVELVVVPTESPALARRLEGRVRVLEYGNVLDAASVRMVREVVREHRAGRTFTGAK